MDSITLSRDQGEVIKPIVKQAPNVFRVAALALFGLAIIMLIGFGPSNIANEFGLSHSTANWVTYIVVYESWEIALWFPWLLPEQAVVDSIYWWLGYSATVNW